MNRGKNQCTACGTKRACEWRLLTRTIWELNASWLSASSRIPCTLAITRNRTMTTATATNGEELFFILSLREGLGPVRWWSSVGMEKTEELWSLLLEAEPFDSDEYIHLCSGTLPWPQAPSSDRCAHVCSREGLPEVPMRRRGNSLCSLCRPLQRCVYPQYGPCLGHCPPWLGANACLKVQKRIIILASTLPGLRCDIHLPLETCALVCRGMYTSAHIFPPSAFLQ